MTAPGWRSSPTTKQNEEIESERDRTRHVNDVAPFFER